MKQKTRQLTTIGMLCALAFVVSFFKIPVILWLKYEPKDVIITIGGFLFGPMASFIISGVVSLLEMVTISETGIIGCIMNLLSTCTFACTAAFVYKKKHTLHGALAGLAIGMWKDQEELTALRRSQHVFAPQKDAADSKERIRLWRRAVERCRNWVETD